MQVAIVNQNKDSKFLLSGHWGYARHTNYTYEILLSLCWSLFGYDTGILVFSYVFYIITLLVHRIKRDHNKCLDKYGSPFFHYDATGNSDANLMGFNSPCVRTKNKMDVK